jgi:hypothetical protein
MLFMIHDHARVAALRTHAAAQLDLISSLESKITQGRLEPLQIARYHTEDVENFILQHLENDHVTLADEALWLSNAERTLQAWTPYLTDLHAQFSECGSVGIQIIGG